MKGEKSMDTMSLNGKMIALLSTDGFEDSELTEPLEAVREAGATVHVISDGSTEIEGKNGTKVAVDKNVEDVSVAAYDGLLLPGGLANPDKMRQNVDAVDFVRDFFTQHKPVAAICHAPWLLIEAGVIGGRTLTSWPSLRTDIENAGGTWVNDEVVVDQGLVTSRNPDDLPAFCDKAIEEFAEGEHEGQVA
jgi:protease I